MSRRGQVLFASFAIVLACSLIASVIGPIIFDAFERRGDSPPAEQEAIDRAIEDAFRATALAAPDDPLANVALANYLANTGRLGEALPYYERAVDLAPTDAAIRFDFGRSLAMGGWSRDAELQFLEAIALDPVNPRYTFFLAELYDNWQPRRVNEALDYYEATIEHAPDSFVAEEAARRIEAILAAHGTPSPAPA